MASLKEIQFWAQGLDMQHPWSQHTFFKKLEAQSSPVTTPYMNPQNFLKAQKSFIHAVDYWSKVLAKLLAEVPEVWQRRLILENLCDENGVNQSINHEFSLSHVETFHQYLLALGLPVEVTIEHVPIDSPTQRFIQNLQKAEAQSWVFLASVLAMIEFAYIDVSQRIADKLEVSDWLNAPQEHYTTHASLDRKHSDDLFQVIEGQPAETIKAGLAYGHKIFYHYYEELAWKYFQPKSLITPDKYPSIFSAE